MEARYITGSAGAGFNYARHAWVEMKVDGEWLTMDPTWGAGYIENDTFIANYTEDYFEPTEEAFKTHYSIGVGVLNICEVKITKKTSIRNLTVKKI